MINNPTYKSFCPRWQDVEANLLEDSVYEQGGASLSYKVAHFQVSSSELRVYVHVTSYIMITVKLQSLIRNGSCNIQK